MFLGSDSVAAHTGARTSRQTPPFAHPWAGRATGSAGRSRGGRAAGPWDGRPLCREVKAYGPCQKFLLIPGHGHRQPPPPLAGIQAVGDPAVRGKQRLQARAGPQAWVCSLQDRCTEGSLGPGCPLLALVAALLGCRLDLWLAACLPTQIGFFLNWQVAITSHRSSVRYN